MNRQALWEGLQGYSLKRTESSDRRALVTRRELIGTTVTSLQSWWLRGTCCCRLKSCVDIDLSTTPHVASSRIAFFFPARPSRASDAFVKILKFIPPGFRCETTCCLVNLLQHANVLQAVEHM
jgi:hypothetical protein